LRGFLVKWFVNILALMAVVNIIPGINADKWQTVVVAALILGLVNAFLRPLIFLFTLPLNILSLGFLTFIINGFLFYSVSKVINGFSVNNFWNAFWGALFFSMISSILSLLINPEGKIELRYYRSASRGKPGYKNVIDVEGKTEK